MLESAVGVSVCLALSALPNVKYPCDVFPSSRFYRKDLAVPELFLSGPSQMKPPAPDRRRPDPDQLARLTVQRATFAA